MDRAGDTAVPPNSEKFHEIYTSVSSDGSAYFHGGTFRNKPDMNDDIYRSRCVNGVVQDQERLEEPINTSYGEYDAFVAPDDTSCSAQTGRGDTAGTIVIYVLKKRMEPGRIR